MVCQGCGASVVDGVHFCARCGAQVVAAQPMYAAYPQPPVPTLAPRVQRNLQTLGILWCVFGAYRVIGGLMGMFFLKTFAFHNFGGFDWPFTHGMEHSWMGAMMPLIAAYIVVTAGLAVFVGYSLLTRRPWGRTFAIIVAVLTLLKPLFGTALGIYTLWVLAPSTSALEYDAIADRS
ncbi:zinc ribbon domain-containing protein [Tunturiibacter lichenicola]|uniref:zinc ribbon domain-containing protein n=1 Tax=Tunturiibacter lichenicola TaxID=2051959 RepID=UPI0021B39950|nr:zinc ribbon domain-containing protein [Edaphobacter lichenicola]